MDTNVMQKQIMRRVYYSYAISIGAHPMLWRGVFLGAAAVLLAKWLHVASIVQNFLTVPVGTAPEYVANSFVHAATHGELMTVVLFVAAGLIGLSSAYHFAKQLPIHTSFMRTA